LYRERLQASADGAAPALAVRPASRDDAAFEYGHAHGLYARALGDLAAAEAHWRELLGLSRALDGQKYVVNRRWLATALLQQGQVAAARELYLASLEDARRINDIRSVAGNTLKLALIDLGQGDLDAAETALADCRAIAARYRDRRRLAECHLVTARLFARRGDGARAGAELHAALDLFERLGMRREASEARAALDELARPVQIP
ncbi:MAG: hypothetical protein HGA45_39960, partial [Chloroflexales bacterium]|nr:hypothetical protein [Chloroflexales bacterium]